MRRLAILVSALALAACGGQKPDAAPIGALSGAGSNVWAAEGKPLSRKDGIEARVSSPDSNATVRLSGDALAVAGRSRTMLPEVGDTTKTEILWSPDSRWLAVNWSDGGLVGTWSTAVYSLDADDRPELHDVAGAVAPLLKDFPKCASPELANVGAAAWLADGKELLVVGEAPPHSSCSNMGEVVGFRVSVADLKVLETIPQTRLLSDWRDRLGPEVLGASRQPSSTHQAPGDRQSHG